MKPHIISGKRHPMKKEVTDVKEKEAHQRGELSIEQAEYVPHPKYDGEYALLLHENYHFLSEEDIPNDSEK